MSAASQRRTVAAARRSTLGMERVSAEDSRQVQTDINGRRYNSQGGYFYMTPADARAHRESANVPVSPAAGPVGRGSGFRCPDCGFGSFIVRCGRCGGTCVREGERS